MVTKVYVLGAGFSKAINESMPLLAELSERVTSRMRGGLFPGHIPGEESFGRDLEAWMSFLNSPQPWLSTAQNLLNRAAFHELTSQISAAILELQSEATSTPPPGWLLSLASRWINEHATVLTFNYDDLAERAARESLKTFDRGVGNSGTNFYPVPLPLASARSPGGLMYGDGGGPVVFPVLKLHGSASWLYSGLGGPHGDTVYRATYADSWKAEGAARSTGNADKVPFIVPPTAVKNEFYGNDLLSSQWRLGAEAIQAADEVHVIGYSAPASDLLVRAFIGSNLRGATLVWVNPDACGLKRLLEFAPHNYPTREFPDVENYVAARGPVTWGCARLGTDHESEQVDVARPFTQATLSTLQSGTCPLCKVALQLDAHRTGSQITACSCCLSEWSARGLLPGRLRVDAI